MIFQEREERRLEVFHQGETSSRKAGSDQNICRKLCLLQKSFLLKSKMRIVIFLEVSFCVNISVWVLTLSSRPSIDIARTLKSAQVRFSKLKIDPASLGQMHSQVPQLILHNRVGEPEYQMQYSFFSTYTLKSKYA